MSDTKKARPRRPQTLAGSRRLTLRLPLGVFDRLQEGAERRGMLISEFARQQIHQAGQAEALTRDFQAQLGQLEALQNQVAELRESLQREKACRILVCPSCGQPQEIKGALLAEAIRLLWAGSCDACRQRGLG